MTLDCMEYADIRGWLMSVDADRTRTTYASITAGGAERCGCAGCRNFRAVVLNSFPADVLAFFERMGIDPLKDAEVYELGETDANLHAYGGEYYFWGTLESQPTREVECYPHFRVAVTSPSPLAQREFREDGALCFIFDAHLPWTLSKDAT